MPRQPNQAHDGRSDEMPALWRRCAQLGANLIILFLVVIGLLTSIGDANSRDLMVGSEQQSLVVICSEDYDIEDLLFAKAHGTFDERWAYLTEHRRCGRYFTEYKILTRVGTYDRYTIVRLLHARGIGYSYTDFDVVAENLQYIADTGVPDSTDKDAAILVVGRPFTHFTGLHTCAALETVEQLLAIVENQGMAAFHAQLDSFVSQGHCGSFAGRFAIRQRLAAKTYRIDGESHQFTTVAILHAWRGRVSTHYTFTNRRVMTPEEYAEYLKSSETYDS